MSTFFQIDLEIIRTIRSKDFSFDFAENISKFIILRRNIRKIRRLCKFFRVSLNVQRVKTKFKVARAQKL